MRSECFELTPSSPCTHATQPSPIEVRARGWAPLQAAGPPRAPAALLLTAEAAPRLRQLPGSRLRRGAARRPRPAWKSNHVTPHALPASCRCRWPCYCTRAQGGQRGQRQRRRDAPRCGVQRRHGGDSCAKIQPRCARAAAAHTLIRSAPSPWASDASRCTPSTVQHLTLAAPQRDPVTARPSPAQRRMLVAPTGSEVLQNKVSGVRGW